MGVQASEIAGKATCTLTEFSAMGISEEFKEDIREAFEIYDKEKEGKFTKDGLGTILRSLGQNPTEGARVGVVTESKSGSSSLGAARIRGQTTREQGQNGASSPVARAVPRR